MITPFMQVHNYWTRNFATFWQLRITAAVYQTLDRLQKQSMLGFWHRAGVRPYTFSIELARSYVFNKQFSR